MLRLVLGGSFDPIHWGHLRPLVEAYRQTHADQMVLLPSAQPPHRQGLGASAEQRFAMAQLAAAELAPLPCVADPWELHQQRPSYTALTLAELRQRWPADSIIFVVGADAFAQLDHWYHWQQLLDHAHLLVLERPSQPRPWSPVLTQFVADHRASHLDALQQQQAGLIGFANTGAVTISATAIRHAIAQRHSWREQVPASVADYIEQQQLYR